MNIKEEKKKIRKFMFEHRTKLLNPFKEEYDKIICNKLEQIILKNNYKTIHAYIPIVNEINITPLLTKLLSNNIKVVCPKTLPKRTLENRILKSLNSLEVGIMGTLHPSKSDVYTGTYDLIIVPGLAFDIRNYRVGFGGGYYDTFLATHPEAFKAGIFYPFQQVDEVPIEPHDFKLDTILVNVM